MPGLGNRGVSLQPGQHISTKGGGPAQVLGSWGAWAAKFLATEGAQDGGVKFYCPSARHLEEGGSTVSQLVK